MRVRVQRIVSRLTYANIMSTLAVFLVVCGGTAYAANTVFSTDIVNGEVKNPDLATDSVSSAKIAADGVSVTDLRDDAVTSAKILTGGVDNVDLASDSVTAAKVAPDSLTGAQILENSLTKVPDTDKVDGLHAHQLSRVASGSTELGYVENGRTTLASATMTVPRKGFVTLIGVATVDYGTCAEFCTTHVRFRDVAAGTEHAAASASGSMATPIRQTIAPSITIPVSPGPHTFELIGSWFGTDLPSWHGRSLTALYTPFNGAGGSIVAASPQAAVAGPASSAPDLVR